MGSFSIYDIAPTVWIISWMYIDHSGYGIIGAFMRKELAEAMLAKIESSSKSRLSFDKVFIIHEERVWQ